MSDKPLARPPQVTMLAAAIMVGSAFVVLLAFDRMGSLGSIEAQESAAEFVSTQPGEGLGITADQAQSLLRLLCVIAGGAAVAAAMLGFRVLKRERSARIALSVVAPVLVLAGLSTASFLSALVGVAVLMLWFQPARDWFDGKAGEPRPLLSPPRTPAHPAVGGAAPGAPREQQPVAPPASWPPPPPGSQPSQPSPYGSAPRSPTGRPPAVLTAAYVTIGSSATVALVLLSVLVTAVADRSRLESDVADQLAGNEMYADLEPGPVVVMLCVMLGVFVLWALAAIVLAVLVLRGNGAARIALVVSAFGAAAASLLGLLVVVPLLVGALAVWVAVLLLRSEVARWYAERRTHSGNP